MDSALAFSFTACTSLSNITSVKALNYPSVRINSGFENAVFCSLEGFSSRMLRISVFAAWGVVLVSTLMNCIVIGDSSVTFGTDGCVYYQV